MKYVSFVLEGEKFAIPIHLTREVLRLGEVSPLPKAPHFIDGVIMLRNHSIVVIDLRKRFNLPALKNASTQNVLIVSIDKMIVGLIVDQVEDIVEISDKQIDSLGKIIPLPGTEKLIQGIAHLEQKNIFIIDTSHLINSDEKEALRKRE